MQLLLEQQLLVKAETDIEEGWVRIRKQEELLDYLHAGGHDTRQAERLIEVLKETLVEWERHRGLIQQRINFLEQDVGPTPRTRN
ncbi:hypothetical protein [Bradyrhizobium macuxiense]|uniref:hypothetical protein n=1 Tax=Bradyrhizobium macuxiense TaxID=1755647 RepID=UPI001FDA12C3|nr:hypothetical protein [Bradyrhizobium macuxiense]